MFACLFDHCSMHYASTEGGEIHLPIFCSSLTLVHMSHCEHWLLHIVLYNQPQCLHFLSNNSNNILLLCLPPFIFILRL